MFWPGGGCGDVGDGLFDDFLGVVGVFCEVAEDGLEADGFFFYFPAVVIGDHGEGGEGDFCFAGEFGFGDVCHADDVKSELAVGVAFCSGGECWAVHVDVGSSVVDVVWCVFGCFFSGGAEDGSEAFADGVCEGYVGCDAVAEEGMFVPSAGAIEVLVKEDDVSGGVLFLEAAYCCDADDV